MSLFSSDWTQNAASDVVSFGVNNAGDYDGDTTGFKVSNQIYAPYAEAPDPPLLRKLANQQKDCLPKCKTYVILPAMSPARPAIEYSEARAKHWSSPEELSEILNTPFGSEPSCTVQHYTVS